MFMNKLRLLRLLDHHVGAAILRLITSSNLLGDRQVGGLGALEDAPGIDSGLIPSAFAVTRLIARSKTVGCCRDRPALPL
jgi:hypothetical protein